MDKLDKILKSMEDCSIPMEKFNLFDYILGEQSGIETWHVANEATVNQILGDPDDVTKYLTLPPQAPHPQIVKIEPEIRVENSTFGFHQMIPPSVIVPQKTSRLDGSNGISNWKTSNWNLTSVKASTSSNFQQRSRLVKTEWSTPETAKMKSEESPKIEQVPEVPINVQPTVNTEKPQESDVIFCTQTCCICNEGFHTRVELEKHLVKVHVNIANPGSDGRSNNDGFLSKKCDYSCRNCKKVFRDNKSFLVHRSLTNALRCHQSDCWQLEFQCETSLVEHYSEKHLGALPSAHPECEICNKIIRSRHGLALHFLTHLENKMFNCQLCDKGFKTSSGLYCHLGSFHNLE